MAKQDRKKTSATTSKKAVGTNLRKQALAKKSDKKRSEVTKSSKSADLRQPKDRDPIQQKVDLLKPSLDHIWNTGVLSSDLVQVAIDYGNQLKIGSPLYFQWNEPKNLQKLWDRPFTRFDSSRHDVLGETTLQEKVDKLFKDFDGDWGRVLRFLVTIFDRDDASKNDSAYTWAYRSIAMQIANTDPFTLFDIDLPAKTSKLSQSSLYFAAERPDDPRLRHELPLSGFWILCSVLFDHLWTVAFQDTLDETPSPALGLIIARLLPPPPPKQLTPAKRPHQGKITELEEDAIPEIADVDVRNMVESQDNTITFCNPPNRDDDGLGGDDGTGDDRNDGVDEANYYNDEDDVEELGDVDKHQETAHIDDGDVNGARVNYNEDDDDEVEAERELVDNDVEDMAPMD